MAKLLLQPNFRVEKDDGTPASDGSLTFQLADTTEDTEVWSDPDLTDSLGATVNINSLGYPEESVIWGADDVSYALIVQATGYNGGSPKRFDPIAKGETTTVADSVSSFALQTALINGAFDGNGGSRSNISGDGNGVEIAPGWFFSQSNAASNAISFPAADSTGPKSALRFGRPVGSTSTDKLRVWATIPTEIAYRLRGKTTALRFSAKAGANFSAGGLSARLATGTSEGEDGDLIDSNGFGGHANPINDVQALTPGASLLRFQLTGDIEDIAEAGIQFSYTGVGTAGANDWVQIEDVTVGPADADDAFPALPEALGFLIAKLSSVARTLVQQTTQALMRTTGLGLTTTGDAVATAASAAAARSAIGAAPLDAPTFTTSVTLPGDPSTSLQASTKQYTDNTVAAAVASVAKRQALRAATTANITISTALNNGDTLDGLTLATGDYVLVKDQSAPAENGVYVVGVSPARAPEFDTYNEHPGVVIIVEEGSTNGDTMWLCTSNAGGTLNTTALNFTRIRIDLAVPVTEAQGGTGSTAFATADEFRANTASKVLATDDVWTSAQPVTISYASSVALDFNTFFDAKITLTGDIAFAAPSNAKPGQKGVIELTQDGSGGHVITSFDSAFVAPGGTSTVSLTTTALARNLLHYEVLGDSKICVALFNDVKH